MSLQAPQTHHAEGPAMPPAEDSLLWEEDAALQITAPSSSVRVLFKEGRGPTWQSTSLYQGDNSSGYRTCWYTALLVPLAPRGFYTRPFSHPPSETAQNPTIKPHGMEGRSP